MNREMVRSWRTGLLLAAVIPLLVSCGKDLQDWNGPDDPLVSPSAMLGEMRALPLQVTEAGGTAVVEIQVLDLAGDPAAGVEVSFAADLGSITQMATSDADGWARATFTAGTASGLALITASIPGLEKDLTILVGQGSLDASPPTVLADGEATVQVTGHVPSRSGGTPAGRRVRFQTSEGVLSQVELVADSTGYVSTFLTSAASLLDVGATVTLVDADNTSLLLGATLVVFRGVTPELSAADSLLLADGISQTELHVLLRETTSGAALASQPVVFSTSLGTVIAVATTDAAGLATSTFTSSTTAGSALVSATFAGTLRDTVRITVSNVALTLTAAADTLVADGESATTLTAWLGNPITAVPLPGETITFVSNLGQVDSTAVTNGAGNAVVRLRAGTRQGACRVQARFRGGITAQDLVEFVGPTTAGVWLGVEPGVLVADGQSQATARAVVSLAGGAPAPDGTSVAFTTEAGVITASATTRSGVATATLTSSTAIRSNVPVVASSGGRADTAYVDFVPGSPARVDVTVTPDSLSADGVSTAAVIAVIEDAVGNPVRDGTVVHFHTTLGRVTSSDLTWTGQAQALYTAATEAGGATIVAEVYPASNDTLRGTASARLIASAEPGDMELTVDRHRIAVADVGEVEMANLAAIVRDENGSLVPDGTPVSFLIIAGPGGGEYLQDPSMGYGPVVVPSASGQARVSLKSGTVAGVVSVRATAGTLSQSATQVTIASGPPARILVTVEHGANTPDLMSCVWYKLVTAFVQDQYANPVEDSTAVYFTLSPGAAATIEGTSVTGVVPTHACNYAQLWPTLAPTSGLAYTCLVYGSPEVFQTYDIIATTAGGGSPVTGTLAAGNTLINGEMTIAVSPAAVDSALGGVVDVGATLRDGCGWYVDGGVVNFTADDSRVSFSPAWAVTVGGTAWSQMTAPPGLGAVTIKVTAALAATGISASTTVKSQ